MSTHKRVIHPSQRTDSDAPSIATCGAYVVKCRRAVCPKHTPDLYTEFAAHRRTRLAVVK